MNDENNVSLTLEIDTPGDTPPDTIILNGIQYHRRKFSDYCYQVDRAIEEIRTLADKNGLTFEEVKQLYFLPVTYGPDEPEKSIYLSETMRRFWYFLT